jgi:hypothetical protein
VLAGLQDGLIDARERRRPYRFRIERRKDVVQRPAEIALDDGDRLRGRKSAGPIEHLAQLGTIGIGQEVGAQRELLPELGEAGAGVLEDFAQARGAALNRGAAQHPVEAVSGIEADDGPQPDEQPEGRADDARLEHDTAGHRQRHIGVDHVQRLPARHGAHDVAVMACVRRRLGCGCGGSLPAPHGHVDGAFDLFCALRMHGYQLTLSGIGRFVPRPDGQSTGWTDKRVPHGRTTGPPFIHGFAADFKCQLWVSWHCAR